MFRIGEFSRIARVSCRLLRYYDELGLLTPSHTDETSGYRYYSVAQLSRLNRILVLRDLGLSLDQIARAMEAELPASELRGMLLMRRAEAEQAIEAEALRLRQIETRLKQIEAEGGLGPDDVVVRPEPARTLLSLRQTVPSLADGVQFVRKLLQTVPRLAGRDVLGELVVIAHGSEFEVEDIDAEFGFFLKADSAPPIQLPDGRELTVRTLPAAPHVATCVRLGLPQEAHLTTARIGQFMEANGYRISGPNREVFLQRPSIDRMQESVVEMQFPVERI